ncbi:MAG: hypothetical protein V1835_03825, partial [Candidatus Micrarchaeota archaeon]
DEVVDYFSETAGGIGGAGGFGTPGPGLRDVYGSSGASSRALAESNLEDACVQLLKGVEDKTMVVQLTKSGGNYQIDNFCIQGQYGDKNNLYDRIISVARSELLTAIFTWREAPSQEESAGLPQSHKIEFIFDRKSDPAGKETISFEKVYDSDITGKVQFISKFPAAPGIYKLNVKTATDEKTWEGDLINDNTNGVICVDCMNQAAITAALDDVWGIADAPDGCIVESRGLGGVWFTIKLKEPPGNPAYKDVLKPVITSNPNSETVAPIAYPGLSGYSIGGYTYEIIGKDQKLVRKGSLMELKNYAAFVSLKRSFKDFLYSGWNNDWVDNPSMKREIYVILLYNGNPLPGQEAESADSPGMVKCTPKS